MALREPAALGWRDPGVPGIAAVEDWLAAREARVPALRPDAAKAILWAGEPAQRTPLALVYVHGFSAAAPELRPVPDRVAAGLGANLHFTRLTGHGSDGAAMATASVADWAADLAEAIAVGRTIGNRVILMGSSMGGALAALAAFDPAYGEPVAGLVLVAPAFRLPGAGGRAITLPWVRSWGPRAFGATRAVPPRSPAHARAWTLTYPTVAVLPLGALVGAIGRLDPARARIPALMLYSGADRVVDPAAIRRFARGWGASCDLRSLTMGPGDDPAAHVIAGDILSPGQTDAVTGLILDWAARLQP